MLNIQMYKGQISLTSHGCTSFSAPGTSRAIISRDKFTTINGKDEHISKNIEDGMHNKSHAGNSSTPSKIG